MKLKLPHLTQRMLLACALCSVPLVATATSAVADESFESASHARQTVVIQAGQAVWARDKISVGATARAERDDAQSFARVVREHLPDPLAGADVVSHKGMLNGDASPFSALLGSISKSADIAVTSPVPEPSTYALMLAGLTGLGFVVMRRRRRMEGLGHEG